MHVRDWQKARGNLRDQPTGLGRELCPPRDGCGAALDKCAPQKGGENPSLSAQRGISCPHAEASAAVTALSNGVRNTVGQASLKGQLPKRSKDSKQRQKARSLAHLFALNGASCPLQGAKCYGRFEPILTNGTRGTIDSSARIGNFAKCMDLSRQQIPSGHQSN